MKNSGRNTFSSFLLKYRGRNYTNFPETWKEGGGGGGGGGGGWVGGGGGGSKGGGVEMEEHI